LGGAGSRGCGQIRFVNITIDGGKKDENFLETIELN
jgi:CRISPR/Cas system CSM-associated protein Csm3 (group 7 of RAMP superfamily)